MKLDSKQQKLVVLSELASSVLVSEIWFIFTNEIDVSLSLSPTALQPGVGLGLLQEFLPSFPV